ncbi:hypothetical protein E2C01_044018 [Portunus trituberculatus]|uniref:Uncharacterized protein n=1 Tax=Portunus trituberculatus TaxID=210409 RepID=A0A5B7FXY6_PORTR|nr:hypothetical protein [Portunus trituberculatus]
MDEAVNEGKRRQKLSKRNLQVPPVSVAVDESTATDVITDEAAQHILKTYSSCERSGRKTRYVY